MARDPEALSRMDVLILTSLARRPMHGYEIKLELEYKHVEWWAKCAHGHLYAALKRLEQRGEIQRKAGHGGARARRIFALTAAGKRRMQTLLESLARSPDQTHFDFDLFLAGAFALERRHALELLAERRTVLQRQVDGAETLSREMSAFVPTAGRLIMDHRLEHLRREIGFVDRAEAALVADAAWGSFLGQEPIAEFVRRTGVPLERRGRKKPALRG